MLSCVDFSVFHDFQCAWLALGFALLLTSLILHLKSQPGWSVAALCLSAFALYCFAALLDPFLNLWDEAFHAVVAQNCLDAPFMPRLHPQHVFDDYIYGNWCSSYVWLHKQPLFLWLICISFQLLGVSTFSLRFPSIMMGCLMALMTYRMAKLLVNSKFAYYAALSSVCSWFLFSLIRGAETCDHNDVCFFCCVCASCWAFTEYIFHERRFVWALAAGFFSGAAILTKWLPGLLVYLVWGLYLLSYHKLNIKEWKIVHIIAALTMTIIIALPWQLYISHQFPDIARTEYQLNTAHFLTVLENHDGSWWYHLKALSFLYMGGGDFAMDSPITYVQVFNYVFIAAGIYSFFKIIPEKRNVIVISGVILSVYTFYSIATTKMPGFTFIVAPIFFMSLGALLYTLDKYLNQTINRPVLRCSTMILLTLFFIYYQFNYRKIKTSLSDSNEFRCFQTTDCQNYKNISKQLPSDCIIFNTGCTYYWENYSRCMQTIFFTHHDCYTFIPSADEIKRLQAQGHTIVFFTPANLPDYISQNPSILKIPANGKQYSSVH